MKTFLIILVCVVTLYILCDIVFSRLINVTYTLKSNKINRSIKAVFVSDFHNGRNGNKILKMIDKENPDVVFLGGDLVDRYTGTKRAFDFSQKLAQKYRVFFAPGNHEYSKENVEDIFFELNKIGVVVLEDEHTLINVKGNRLDICGVYDSIKQSEKADMTQLNRINMVSDKSAYRVLLAHFPKFAKGYSRREFELILCGHEHGGILRFPPYCNGFIGHSGLHPMFAGGYYKLRYSAMIVSRGVCFPYYNCIIPRLFNNPQLVTINITGK